MYKKILIILISFIIIISIFLSTIFRKRYVLLRIADKSSLKYYKFYGTGDIVIKNPFRDRTLEKKVRDVLELIRNQKTKNNNEDLKKYFENNQDSLKEDFDITLNRASENPTKMLKDFNIHDIVQKNGQVVFILYFKPNGTGCMVLNSESHKVKNFFVVY